MGSNLILSLLEQFLSKEVLKKLVKPIMDALLDKLVAKAAETDAEWDDAAAKGLKQAADDILAAWQLLTRKASLTSVINISDVGLVS